MIYLDLWLTFLKIGAFTFGGGYAMLPLIQEEVLIHGWMESSALINFIAVSESTPGPFAVNVATYVGAEMGGILGSVCATAGVVLPSFLIILIVARGFEKFKESRIVKGCMAGLKPAVVGLIGTAVLSVASTVFFSPENSFYVAFIIFAVSVLLAFKKVHPIVIICMSAAMGVIGGILW